MSCSRPFSSCGGAPGRVGRGSVFCCLAILTRGSAVSGWTSSIEGQARRFATCGRVVSIFHGISHWRRSEEHTSELQSLMRISYAVFCLKKKKKQSEQNISSSQKD